MNVEISRKEKDTHVTLEGNLTVHNAARLREALLEALSKSEHIHIDLSAVGDVDLSCLQLLWSATNTAKKEGKRISFNKAMLETLNDISALAGFPKFE